MKKKKTNIAETGLQPCPLHSTLKLCRLTQKKGFTMNTTKQEDLVYGKTNFKKEKVSKEKE